MAEPTRPVPDRADRTRWDVQGLRAFAVLAVVVYHLWPNRVPGGFVGVDVFFVISGYLITRHLLREQVATGRIALGAFWARRAKRLLPGAALTLLATGTAVLVLVPSTLWGQYGRELIASTVYLQNWQLASDSVDYLASDNDPSPFQHFWSLSVEEQFYIALPVLLVVLTAALRRTRGHSPVRTARLLLGAVVVLSLVWCVVETRTAPGIAYFSTATRAWEFALGGLAASVLTGPPRSRTTAAVRTGGAWLGAALLVASLWTITPATPYPGTAALLPVVGATLVVLLGGRSGLAVLGRWAPVAGLGRISYAVYLWHWPAVVLLPIVTGHSLGTRDKVAILVGSVVVAALSTRFVEEPLRFSARVSALRPRRVAVWGVLSTLVVVALGAATLGALQVQQAQAAAYQRSLEDGDVPCFGAAAGVGTADPCTDPRLADVRVPVPSAAGSDDVNRYACWSNTTPDFNVCRLGPSTGYTRHVAAIGDSHNNALLSAYAAIAEERNWRIDVAGHVGCYLTTAEQQAPSDAYTASCDGWKQAAFAWVRDHPDLDALVVTHAATKSPVIVPEGSTNEATVVDGLVGAWRNATDVGVPVLAIRDNPVARNDVLTCLGRMTGPTTDACDSPRTAALSAFDGSAEAVARLGDRAAFVDLTDRYCSASTCPAVIGGVVVHRDPTHVTATFATTLAPYLGDALADALGEVRG
ncbi:acyltransferase family protein [Curtobacterium sp. MCBD17_021]|uniref:acyltransferase family protein n=1 Tax=Curtobacterium sp. MCBD17_021 TaxID=2175665 RepID=UPI0015E8E3B9|nr:acyltransferase family protein [Curtobacterium sp. MCBD17_021]